MNIRLPADISNNSNFKMKISVLQLTKVRVRLKSLANKFNPKITRFDRSINIILPSV